jgi:site-specific DNA-methyltransferase (adenine-specific)
VIGQHAEGSAPGSFGDHRFSFNSRDVTAPATDAARQWSGWGTALKPAWEPVILARKPLAGTVAANVLAHGTGGLNVDGCRIAPTGETLEGGKSIRGYTTQNEGWTRPCNHDPEAKEQSRRRGLANVAHAEAAGRWPANVLLDEEAAATLDEQSGELTSGALSVRAGRIEKGQWREHEGRADPRIARKDYLCAGSAGGASRFFYTAKAASGERHYAGRNGHPTVKPVDLMRWLCRLVTPPGGLVLDPFCGSGSTGVAALADGFRFIGMEQDAEWCAVARRRIAGPLFAEQEAPA